MVPISQSCNSYYPPFSLGVLPNLYLQTSRFKTFQWSVKIWSRLSRSRAFSPQVCGRFHASREPSINPTILESLLPGGNLAPPNLGTSNGDLLQGRMNHHLKNPHASPKIFDACIWCSLTLLLTVYLWCPVWNDTNYIVAEYWLWQPKFLS